MFKVQTFNKNRLGGEVPRFGNARPSFSSRRRYQRDEQRMAVILCSVTVAPTAAAGHCLTCHVKFLHE